MMLPSERVMAILDSKRKLEDLRELEMQVSAELREVRRRLATEQERFAALREGVEPA